MKLCSKILALAILTSTFALVSCSGPTTATSSYNNVSISLQYYPICNGCAFGIGLIGSYYGVVPPGSGGLTGAPNSECTTAQNVAGTTGSVTCTNNGTVLCTGPLCQTTGAVIMPPGGASGGCIELFANVQNAPSNTTWSIVPANLGVGGVSSGTLQGTTGAINFYCIPTAIPIYTGVQLAQAQAAGIPQGYTEVVATNPADPNNPSNVVSTSMFFTIQVNSPPTGVSVGILQGTSTEIPLNSNFQFTGWVAGINGFIVPSGSTAPTGGCVAVSPVCIAATSKTWALAACSGGPALVTSSSNNGITVTNYGTLNTATGLYTAPAAYPAAAYKCANITVASTAYPSVISTATLINFP